MSDKEQTNLTFRQMFCKVCEHWVHVKTIDHKMLIIMYPANIMFEFDCPCCDFRTTQHVERAQMKSGFVEWARDAGTPIIMMPEPEHPTEADFPQFTEDDLIDFGLGMDLELQTLLDSGRVDP